MEINFCINCGNLNLVIIKFFRYLFKWIVYCNCDFFNLILNNDSCEEFMICWWNIINLYLLRLFVLSNIMRNFRGINEESYDLKCCCINWSN